MLDRIVVKLGLFRWMALCLLLMVAVMVLANWSFHVEVWEYLSAKGMPFWQIILGMILTWLRNDMMEGLLLMVGFASWFIWHDAVKNMRIWELTVIDPSAPEWAASMHKGSAIVRAADEEMARSEAAKAFGIATKVKLGAPVLGVPWSQSRLVSCAPYSGAEHPAAGKPGVLSPKNT